VIVYKLTSPEGKSYIGRTNSTLDERFKQHIQAWKRGKCKLYKAFDTHDPTTWSTEILLETNDPTKEKEMIEKLNTIVDGYNMEPPVINNWKNGVYDTRPPQTPEQKEKIRLSRTGKPQTLKQKQAAQKANSKEWIITYPDGHEEKIINLNEFCRQHNLDQGNMSRNQNGSHKGFKARKL